MGVFMSYDPIKPDDAFGRTMIRNVESRGCAFSGIYDAPDVASAARRFTTNARLRYNFREGQDLWLVWNEGLNLDRDVLGAPRLPRTNARTLTMKYTHTLVL